MWVWPTSSMSIGRSNFIGQPQRRLFPAILKQRIRRRRVAHQKVHSVSSRRSLQRKIAQIPPVFFVEHGTRIPPRLFRHSTKARGASRVFIEAYRVVVISAHDYRRLFAHEVDDLRGIRPVVHQVAQNPKLIEVGRQRADGLKVGVKIRNDQHSHQFYPAVTAVSFGYYCSVPLLLLFSDQAVEFAKPSLSQRPMTPTARTAVGASGRIPYS